MNGASRVRPLPHRRPAIDHPSYHASLHDTWMRRCEALLVGGGGRWPHAGDEAGRGAVEGLQGMTVRSTGIPSREGHASSMVDDSCDPMSPGPRLPSEGTASAWPPVFAEEARGALPQRLHDYPGGAAVEQDDGLASDRASPCGATPPGGEKELSAPMQQEAAEGDSLCPSAASACFVTPPRLGPLSAPQPPPSASYLACPGESCDSRDVALIGALPPRRLTNAETDLRIGKYEETLPPVASGVSMVTSVESRPARSSPAYCDVGVEAAEHRRLAATVSVAIGDDLASLPHRTSSTSPFRQVESTSNSTNAFAEAVHLLQELLATVRLQSAPRNSEAATGLPLPARVHVASVGVDALPSLDLSPDTSPPQPHSPPPPAACQASIWPRAAPGTDEVSHAYYAWRKRRAVVTDATADHGEVDRRRAVGSIQPHSWWSNGRGRFDAVDQAGASQRAEPIRLAAKALPTSATRGSRVGTVGPAVAPTPLARSFASDPLAACSPVVPREPSSMASTPHGDAESRRDENVVTGAYRRRSVAQMARDQLRGMDRAPYPETALSPSSRSARHRW